MNASIAITQFLGIIFTVIGLSMVFDKKGVTGAMEEMIQKRSFLWLMGLIALAMGSVLVVLNNTWTSGLPLFVTIVGWLVLAKGIFILLFPHSAIALYKKYNTPSILVPWGIVVFILGLVFLYLGFI